MTTKPGINLALEGHYRFVAVRPDGGERVLADWGSNVILDAGLDRLGFGGVFSHCHVGSGSTSPSETQTGLQAHVAGTSTIQSQSGGTNSPTSTYAYIRRVYRFAAGVAAGNLSEVGVGWDAGLFSRALIKDEDGDPTTITVLSDEILDVTYEVRAYPTLTDQVAVIPIAGDDYTFTLRPFGLTGDLTNGWANAIYNLLGVGMTIPYGAGLGAVAFASNASLAPITALSMSGTALVASSTSTPSFRSPYANNSLRRECRITWSIDQGTQPFGGFGFHTAVGLYQALVSPPIPKDGSKTFALDFTVSWGRRA